MEDTDQPPFIAKQHSVPILMSVVVQVLLLFISVWFFLPGIIPSYVYYTLFCLLCVAGCLFLAHLVLSALVSGRGTRIQQFCAAVAIVITVSFVFWASGHHRRLRYEWFIRDGTNIYGKAVAIVEAERSSLGDQDQPRFQFELRKEVFANVYACTNKDGSLMVWIKPRENNPRLGYFYSSSSERLTACPWDDRNHYFFHLTNGWYEY